jgi:tetratricopeptide (TPR) repeat protein
LQFAYYESSLVVEFLVESYGFEALNQVLNDLAAGLPIDEALERRTTYLATLEQDFEQFVRQRAEQLAPEADWQSPDLASLVNDDGAALEQWLDEHPHNIPALTAFARQLIEQERWQDAKRPLLRLIELYPNNVGRDNPYELLARVHRALEESEQEVAVLRAWAALDADAIHIFLKLLDVDVAAQRWDEVRQNAERAIAVNPLLSKPYRSLARAADEQDDRDSAIVANQTLLKLEPDDPADVHFRLAQLLHVRGDAAAKRHVLMALEEAPRFRAAHQLLLRIHRRQD